MYLFQKFMYLSSYTNIFRLAICFNFIRWIIITNFYICSYTMLFIVTLVVRPFSQHLNSCTINISVFIQFIKKARGHYNVMLNPQKIAWHTLYIWVLTVTREIAPPIASQLGMTDWAGTATDVTDITNL